MPTSTVFSAKHHKCLSTCTSFRCVFTVIRDEQRRPRPANVGFPMGICWGDQTCPQNVVVDSFLCAVRTIILLTFISQFVFDCSDDLRCVRTAAIASYDDVGRSPAPRPIEMSLSKKISLCTSTILRCPGRYLCHLHPQKKFPKVFVFRRKCMWWKDHRQR